MLPSGPGSSVIRTGRISDGFLVLDGCFVALSVPVSVPTTDVASPFMLAPVDEIVVGSGFVVTSLLSSSSSELQ